MRLLTFVLIITSYTTTVKHLFMKNILFLALLVLFFTNSSFATLFPISAPGGVCVGATGLVYDSTGGGTWSSSNTSVATVGSVIGHYAYVTGISAGSATITYTSGGSYVTTLIVVSPVPAPIVGPDSICTGSSATYTDAVSGGTWSSWSTGMTIGSTTGVVTSTMDDEGGVYYTMGPGCYADYVIRSYSTYPGGLAGPRSVCLGSVITLTDSVTGTTWSSSAPSIATVSSSGDVTGIAAGITTISYAVSGTCGTAYATLAVTVNTTTFPGAISGTSSILVGTSTTIYESVPGGTWSSSDASVASVGSLYYSSYATLTGVSAGTAVITYSMMGCSGLATATFPVTVNALNGISGYIHFSDPYVRSYSGPVKVWLITFDPGSSELQAIDSTVVTCSSSMAYYQFTGVPTDSVRIKASVNSDTSTAPSSYMPTYRDSSYYWHDANVLWHVSGSSDVNKDIWMLYGATHTGPGFIAGDVTTGANRGTSASAPAVGLCVYLLNSSGIQVQQAYTNAAGHYSFSNLPVGTSYTVFPEALNYSTIAYTGISLTSSSPSMSGAGFIQHTLSHTITPMTEAVGKVSSSSSIAVFPNPTTGNIFIQWTNKTIGNADVTISDLAGRTVFSSTININTASGQSQLNVNDLNNGIYLISIKGEGVNYNGKVMVQH